MSEARHRLFCFGLGYTAEVLARALMAEGWAVAGTCREVERCAALAELGIDAWLFDGEQTLDDAATVLAGTTHLLASAPPGNDGDPAAGLHATDIAAVESLEWIGYLSTTGVYGNHRGLWVDEETPVAPSGERGLRRVLAEAQWLEFWENYGIAAQVFRLAGIYGPDRGPLAAARAGTAKRIVKDGQVFSRIHVDDIVAVLRASMARPDGGRVYNVCDDKPAPPQDAVAFACELLGVEPPPLVDYHDAALSPLAESFYADNRRVRNDRIKDELGVVLKYPDYEAGLRALARDTSP
jgi:nucleoside-diphosphate-sugar epimerase